MKKTPSLFNLLFLLVIEHAVAKALEIGVFDLVLEFGAHAFRVGRALKTAGAVAVLLSQAFAHDAHRLFVRVLVNAHDASYLFPHVLCLREFPCRLTAKAMKRYDVRVRRLVFQRVQRGGHAATAMCEDVSCAFADGHDGRVS